MLASKSNKLSSDLVMKWFVDIFLPNVSEASVLCLNSFGQIEEKFDVIDKHGKRVKILTIPQGQLV